MNTAAQIEGERIVKAEAQRAQALEALASTNYAILVSWRYLLIAVLGAGWGWIAVPSLPQGLAIVAAVAGAGFFLAAAAYREAAIARRRVDALLVLTRADGGQRPGIGVL
ncbi:MAG: hypothetical protein ACT4NV_11165 [Rhodoferax sp.]